MLLLKPVEIDPAKPYFAWERPRQLGNSVLYLPPDDPIVAAFEDLMEQEELTPDWLALRHRLTFVLRQLRGGSNRLSDIRVAIYGPAALTALARRAGELHHALPKKSFYAVHAEPKLFFEPSDFSALIADPEIIGLSHLAERPRQRAAGAGQPVCVGGGAIWQLERVQALRRDLAPRKASGKPNRATQCPIAAIASAIAIVRLAMSACSRSTIRPSSWIAPREAFSGRSNAAMILRACATSSAGGVKIALQASIWPGWISVLPSKPRSRPCAHSWPKPSTLLKSL